MIFIIYMKGNNSMKRYHKINEELTKGDVKSMMSSEYKSADFKKAVKEISAEVIEDLFRTLWNRSSMWKGGITRSARRFI